jgi:hypothetical protein
LSSKPPEEPLIYKKNFLQLVEWVIYNFFWNLLELSQVLSLLREPDFSTELTLERDRVGKTMA